MYNKRREKMADRAQQCDISGVSIKEGPWRSWAELRGDNERKQESTWKLLDEQVSNRAYATERTNGTQHWRLANRS